MATLTAALCLWCYRTFQGTCACAVIQRLIDADRNESKKDFLSLLPVGETVLIQ